MRTIAYVIHGQLGGPYGWEMTWVSLELLKKFVTVKLTVMSPACVFIP